MIKAVMQPTTMLPKLTDATQTISFSEGDGVCSAEVYAADVVVTTNAGNHDHGSSKVKLKNLVDYNWEPKSYSGQLLAIHISGKYLAYSIKAPNALNPSTCSGMVRVVYNPEPGTDRRALIKGMKGEVQDLAFAHIQSQVVLASIDEQGNFYVHEIEVTDSGLRCTLMAEIREDTWDVGNAHRVVWCPYIPDEDDESPDDDVAMLLLTTHANIGRMWNMRAIVRTVAGAGGAGTARALAGGGAALTAAEHCAAIVDAAFSPDGTALATASADGYVMFFQVYMHHASSPRCLHKWQPHGGRPLSCLFFLDNHKNYNTDVQFWKFAVTGADNNTVIKIWSCKSWNCLQTITFTPGVASELNLGLKAMLDASASYLLLSDLKTRCLYVLNMARDADDSAAYCKSISEFLLPYPVLSFCIVDAEEQQASCESRCSEAGPYNGAGGPAPHSPLHYDLQHDEEGSGGSCGAEGGARVCVRLYIVQPKGLQEGRLSYTPPPPHHELSDLTLEDKSSDSTPAAIASSILQQQSQQLKNLLMRSQTQPGSLIVSRADSPPSAPPPAPPHAPPLNLMTPDAFSSPGKREEEDPPLSATPDALRPALGPATDLASIIDPATGAAGVGGGVGGVGGAPPASAGSSPSREVQQIMALNKDDTFYQDQMEDEVLSTPPAAPAEGGVPTVDDADPPSGPEPLAPSDHASHAPQPPLPHKLTHANSDTSWPQISMAQITEANQRKASSDKSSCQSLNNSLSAFLEPEESPAPPAPSAAPLFAPPAPRLDQLELKLDKLTELVSQQSRELHAMRGAVPDSREIIEEALHAHTQRTTQAIENALSLGWERIGRAGEAAAGRAAQAAGLGAARALEPLAAALQHELAAKLSTAHHLLRDNIDKLVNSKSVTERLSTALAAALADTVRDSFRAALCDNVVPLMEKAHAQIFKQINHAFQNGTKEFAAHAEAAARAAAERGGAAGAAALRAALDRHADALAAHAAQPAHASPPIPHAQQLTAVIRDAIHSVLEKELSWWREQARSAVALASRAHSPATSTPHSAALDRQMQVAQIQSLIASGDVNGAFQQALSASDLSLVVAACRAAEPAHVFGPPCRLQQHVLLSLVQQLAADMSRDTQLKHRYLEEAVMNLDTSSPVTREHLPAVVRELQKQVVAFVSGAPHHALARQFRMLLMASEALLKGAA